MCRSGAWISPAGPNQLERPSTKRVFKLLKRGQVFLQLSSALRPYLPHILVGLSISLIMVGAYAAVGFASSSQPKVMWAADPVRITFTAVSSTSSGSLGDS